jgi:hypothetical protein
MKQKMEELQKQLKNVKPMDPQQMQEFKNKMKDLNNRFYQDNGAEPPKPPTAPAPKTAPESH